MAPQDRAAPRPERRTEAAIALLFLLSMAGGLLLVVVYVRGGQVQLEGVGLFATLLGLSLGLGLWAHRFMPGGEAVQERHPLASSEEERARFAADFEQGEQTLTRRRLLLTLLVGGLGALGAAAVLPFRSLGPRPLTALRTTSWRAGTRLVDEKGAPVHRDALAVDGILTVFPEGSPKEAWPDSQTLLIRTDPGILRLPEGRGDWAPEGYVAYSKVCTHAGCPVGLYDTVSHQLVCPCHQSLFDVIEGAKPVFGPATRSLPQLPIEVDGEGYLRARSDYTEPVGPAFWSRD